MFGVVAALLSSLSTKLQPNDPGPHQLSAMTSTATAKPDHTIQPVGGDVVALAGLSLVVAVVALRRRLRAAKGGA
jgi:hypothetical protein